MSLIFKNNFYPLKINSCGFTATICIINLQLPMTQKNDFISPEELTNMTLRFYALNFDIKATAQAFKDIRSEEQVIYTIKCAIKEHLLNIEYELRRIQKIEKLRFFDHMGMNKNMFHQFININQILQQQEMDNFFDHFKFKRMNPSWYRLPRRLQMPLELIDSNKKLQIYEKFIKYFQEKKLFEVHLQYEEEKIDDMKQQFIIGEFPTIYMEQDICRIYRMFEMNNGDIEVVMVKLKQQGFTNQKISIENLQGLLIDCMITGLCRIYKATHNEQMYLGFTWNKFRKANKPLIAKNCPLQVKIALARIGIYDNASKYEQKLVCDCVGVKAKTRREYVRRDKKDTRYYRLKEGTKKAFLDIIKNEMRKVMREEWVE